MEIKLTLSLPRDALSVPVVRRICAESMRVLGVNSECITDLEVALTEACANVLGHAQNDDDYEVSAGIDGAVCVIEVVDRGRGFSPDGLGHEAAGPQAESGRGIQLMRSLVDNVKFVSRPEKGTIVHLEKSLTWREGAPIEVLSEGRGPSEHGPWAKVGKVSPGPLPVDRSG